MRLTEPRPKTWSGAVPEMTRLMTAIVLEKGSLTNSWRTTPFTARGRGMYGFIITPNRGSTPGESSQLRPTIDWTVPAGTHDCVDSDAIPLTEEFLGQM